MQISIPDDLYQRYADAAKRAKKPTAALVVQQLERFVDAPPTQRSIILTGEALQEADTLLGIGSTADAATLLAAIRRWAGITIGDIRLPFSPSQLQEIAHRAQKQGKTPEAICRDIIDQMAQDFFWGPTVAR